MNWVDLVTATILILFGLKGWGRSFFFEALDLTSFLVSFAFSLKFYNLAAKQFEVWFTLPHSLANVLGFIIVWYLIEMTFLILFTPLSQKLSRFKFWPWENTFSIIPAFLKGVVFVALILILVATFPIQPKIKKDVQNSKLGSAILSQAYQLEVPLKNVFGGLANDTLTFFTIHPQSNERIRTGFQTTSFSFDDKMETTMIDLVNKERVNLGLSSLTFDEKLREVARIHSADMFQKGYFSHYSLTGQDVADRAQSQGVGFLVVGENLAYAPSLELAHQGIMRSPGHKANILSPDYHKIGIGIANGSEYGFMITQVFMN